MTMRYYSLILGIIVIVHSANVMQVFGQEPDYVIVTEADAFISGRNNGNDAHGAADNQEKEYLVVKNEGEPVAGNGFYRESIMRFDLSPVEEEIGTVQLKMWNIGKPVDTGLDSMIFGTYFCPDDDWDEFTVTWNTAPIPNFDAELGIEPLFTLKSDTGSYKVKGAIKHRTHYGWNRGGELDPAVLERERTGDKKITIDLFAKTKKLDWADPDTWTAFVARDSVGVDSLHARLLIWKKGNDPSTAVRTKTGQSVPEGYLLQANYPNPFNPSTQISYFLKQTQSAQMSIYNTLGQAIRIFDLPATSGWHTLTWDGCDQSGVRVPSGIYLYQLKADDTRLTRKMVLTQ
ncbi:T9SS type A sorting domain-containing protein [candidate division KSB1 bacterium]|nr:T9SS type A sorting domain-containing protein [candidate division KSB1 bacterium]